LLGGEGEREGGGGGFFCEIDEEGEEERRRGEGLGLELEEEEGAPPAALGRLEEEDMITCWCIRAEKPWTVCRGRRTKKQRRRERIAA